jgi:hypothetical protein
LTVAGLGRAGDDAVGAAFGDARAGRILGWRAMQGSTPGVAGQETPSATTNIASKFWK